MNSLMVGGAVVVLAILSVWALTRLAARKATMAVHREALAKEVELVRKQKQIEDERANISRSDVADGL